MATQLVHHSFVHHFLHQMPPRFAAVRADFQRRDVAMQLVESQRPFADVGSGASAATAVDAATPGELPAILVMGSAAGPAGQGDLAAQLIAADSADDLGRHFHHAFSLPHT